MNITIIGTGVYGIAMALCLSQNKKLNIKMWTESDASFKHLEESRDSFNELGGVKVPKEITFTTSFEEALDGTNLVFIMTAAKFVSNVCKSMKPFITDKMHFVIGSKGIEQVTCRFIDEIFRDEIETDNLAVISGPTFAIDIASLEPIALSVASKNPDTIALIKNAYENTNAKLRETDDLVGLEVCGSIKNVYALSTGILSGLGYKESTRSFMVTEAIHDIKKLIKDLGGDENTILSYAGVGDLLLTATSEKSRNYSYGILIGENKKEEASLFLKNNTVEGVYTLNSVHELLKLRNIKMPFIDIIYEIVNNHADPRTLVDFLMKK